MTHLTYRDGYDSGFDDKAIGTAYAWCYNDGQLQNQAFKQGYEDGQLDFPHNKFA